MKAHRLRADKEIRAIVPNLLFVFFFLCGAGTSFADENINSVERRNAIERLARETGAVNGTNAPIIRDMDSSVASSSNVTGSATPTEARQGEAVSSAKRHALVVGCDYPGTKLALPSPVKDAHGFAAMLKDTLGFEVVLKINPNRRELLEAMDSLGESLKQQSGVGLFYFSGHGAQHEGANYLIPAGAHLKYQEDLPTEAVAAQMAVTRMEAAGNGLNLVFLDACRDHPLPSARTKSVGPAGLQPMRGSGTLIGFAADAGAPAYDSGAGSYYTNALLRHLPAPGISVVEALTRVRKEVKETVSREEGEIQEPFVYLGLDEVFSFVPGPPAREVNPTMLTSPTVSSAEKLWSATKDAPYVNSLGLEFIPLPGRTGVWMARTETRKGDFRAFVEATDYIQTGGAYLLTFKPAFSGKYDTAWELDINAGWDRPGFEQDTDHPVVCVSWEDARAFCKWLSSKEKGLTYRLPTDAEWSLAVGTSDKYPWGNDLPAPEGSGNFLGRDDTVDWPGVGWTTAYGHSDGAKRTARVARYEENQFGFFDLGGNVAEWCEDLYIAAMNDADALNAWPGLAKERASDGTSFRVLRGSSWEDQIGVFLRSSFRNNAHPNERDDVSGFRVVVVADDE